MSSDSDDVVDSGAQVDAVEVAADELAHAPDLACVVRGQFALYQRAGGAMEIFYDVGGGMVRRSVPAPVVAMMTGKGPMAGMLRKAFGG